MFGFRFEENFNNPYLSKSITEFWRRWHVSLGNWFRDYVYIPLGGSRVKTGRHLINLFIVWSLTGIWHGANYTFIAWGIWYFLLLVLEKYLIKPEQLESKTTRTLWHALSLICVMVGWVIFNARDIGFAKQYILALLGITGNGYYIDAHVISSLREYGFYILAGVLWAVPIPNLLERGKLSSLYERKWFDMIEPVVGLFLFLWAVSFLILGAHNPFIYFNF